MKRILLISPIGVPKFRFEQPTIKSIPFLENKAVALKFFPKSRTDSRYHGEQIGRGDFTAVEQRLQGNTPPDYEKEK